MSWTMFAIQREMKICVQSTVVFNKNTSFKLQFFACALYIENT